MQNCKLVRNYRQQRAWGIYQDQDRRTFGRFLLFKRETQKSFFKIYRIECDRNCKSENENCKLLTEMEEISLPFESTVVDFYAGLIALKTRKHQILVYGCISSTLIDLLSITPVEPLPLLVATTSANFFSLCFQFARPAAFGGKMICAYTPDKREVVVQELVKPENSNISRQFRFKNPVYHITVDRFSLMHVLDTNEVMHIFQLRDGVLMHRIAKQWMDFRPLLHGMMFWNTSEIYFVHYRKAYQLHREQMLRDRMPRNTNNDDLINQSNTNQATLECVNQNNANQNKINQCIPLINETNCSNPEFVYNQSIFLFKFVNEAFH